MKKILSIILILAMTLGLFGCGTSGPSGKYEDDLFGEMNFEFSGKKCRLYSNNYSYEAEFSMNDEGVLTFTTKCPPDEAAQAMVDSSSKYTAEDIEASLMFYAVSEFGLRYDKSSNKIVGSGDYALYTFSPAGKSIKTETKKEESPKEESKQEEAPKVDEPMVNKDDITEAEVQAFIDELFGDRSWNAVSYLLIPTQEVKNNYQSLNDGISIEFFADTIMYSDYGKFSKNTNEKDYATWVDLDEMLNRGVVTQAERDAYVELAYEEGRRQGYTTEEELEMFLGEAMYYLEVPNEYVRKGWLQELFDHFYGKGVINISKWEKEASSSGYFLYSVGGVGDSGVGTITSQPTIESIDGKTAKVSIMGVSIDYWGDNPALYDLFSNNKINVSGLSYEKLDKAESAADFSETCKILGISESQLSKATITIYKDSTGVYTKGYDVK